MLEPPSAPSTSFALDTHALDSLKREARTNPRAALKGAAQQFEALFLQEVLKSMRAALPKHGIFDNEQTREYTSMLDAQLAQTLSQQGAGMLDLSQLLLQELRPGMPGFERLGPSASRQTPAAPTQEGVGTTSVPGASAPNSLAPAQEGAASAGASGAASAFVAQMRPHALEASRATGIPARFLLGQAALESGWGQHQIRRPDGQPSYNVFGIKAGAGWNGSSVVVPTTEYVNGVAQRILQKFRAYDSYAAAFADYAHLIAGSARYAGVRGQAQSAAGFAQSLQNAGYATDPRYAEKLTQVIESAPLSALAA